MAQGLIRYRCFLPDLTEFTVPPCTGPNYQQSTSRRLFHRVINTVEQQAMKVAMVKLASPKSDSLHGGEGGIRTPGTRIRGTHDFQSCTFNHSVTSPIRSKIIKPLDSACFETNTEIMDFLQIGKARIEYLFYIEFVFTQHRMKFMLNVLTFSRRQYLHWSM